MGVAVEEKLEKFLTLSQSCLFSEYFVFYSFYAFRSKPSCIVESSPAASTSLYF